MRRSARAARRPSHFAATGTRTRSAIPSLKYRMTTPATTAITTTSESVSTGASVRPTTTQSGFR